MKNRSGNILVEGTSDEKFLKKYFDNSKARFFPDKQERVVNQKKAKRKIKFVFKELQKRKFPNSKYFCIGTVTTIVSEIETLKKFAPELVLCG